MSLQLIEQSIRVASRTSMSLQAWRQAEELRAEKVERFRRYADGDHDNRMTTEQRRMLNIRGTSADSAAFSDNLCAIILDTALDRIQLTGVDARAPKSAVRPTPTPAPMPAAPDAMTPPMPTPTVPLEAPPVDPTQAWVNDLLERNRIDALQVNVHEAALRDGNTYLMVYPDFEHAGTADEQRVVRFSHEPAYDGSYGMVVLYETNNSPTPLLAVKVWRVSSATTADTVRVNVYYPDRIERFGSKDVTTGTGVVTALAPYSEDGEAAVIPWRMPDGTPIGVPVIHFRNRGSSADNFGLSDLESVIPLQDASNVVLTSLVATALLSGFPIRGMVGGTAPAAVAPGQVLSFDVPKDAQTGHPVLGGGGVGNAPTAIDLLNAVRFLQYDVAELHPLIEVAQYLKTEMYAVTNTPTDDVAADASGEARKQSEVKLIGKVKRFEVRNGNAWEDAVRMAHRIQQAFSGDAPPPLDKLTATWADAELRNDSAFVADMLTQYREGVIDQRTYLEAVADVYDWTDEKIDEIIQRTETARSAAPLPNQITPQDAAGVEALLAQLEGAPEPNANATMNEGMNDRAAS